MAVSGALDIALIRVAALLESDPAAAARAAHELVRQHPGHSAATLLLASALRRSGDAQAAGTEAATSHVIIHVIEMAKSLGLEAVAEGVETARHVAWLIEHGVALGQGFLFSKALTAGDFREFFHANENRQLIAA